MKFYFTIRLIMIPVLEMPSTCGEHPRYRQFLGPGPFLYDRRVFVLRVVDAGIQEEVSVHYF